MSTPWALTEPSVAILLAPVVRSSMIPAEPFTENAADALTLHGPPTSALPQPYETSREYEPVGGAAPVPPVGPPPEELSVTAKLVDRADVLLSGRIWSAVTLSPTLRPTGAVTVQVPLLAATAVPAKAS